MTKEQEVLIHLLAIALNDKPCNSLPFVEWKEVMDLAFRHEVMSVAFDGYQKLHQYLSDNVLSIDDLMEWLGQSSYQETIYEQYKETTRKLAEFYSLHGLRMLLLKGLGLSFNYPVPNHRPCGDIDIYLYGYGGKADALILSEFGIHSKQNEEKHSIFRFDGITVENHACLINDTRHPSQKLIEVFFEKDAENAVSVETYEGSMKDFFLPSVETNALYLPIHIADHFVHGEASLRQLCDWACFVKKNHNYINWTSTESWAKKTGFFQFYCCLNGIVQDYLGIDSSFFPQWPRAKKLEERVMSEILCKKDIVNLSLPQKIVRFFFSAWKFRLVYNENIFIASLRQARAFALVKWNKGGNGIWEK